MKLEEYDAHQIIVNQAIKAYEKKVNKTTHCINSFHNGGYIEKAQTDSLISLWTTKEKDESNTTAIICKTKKWSTNGTCNFDLIGIQNCNCKINRWIKRK